MPEDAPTPLPQAPLSAHARAAAALHALLTSPTPAHRGVLVVGPSGSGKTTLLLDACARAGVALTSVSAAELRAASPGCEALICAAFAPPKSASATPVEAEEKASGVVVGGGAPRRAVLLDHLDAAAPPGTHGLRVAAALGDALAAAREDAAAVSSDHRPPLLLAVANNADAIHPSLVRPGRFSLVLPLAALTLPDRVSWSRRMLRALFPSVQSGDSRNENFPERSSLVEEHLNTEDATSEEDVWQQPAHSLARLTPGFLPADMVYLLRRLDSAIREATSPPDSATALLTSGLAAREAACVTLSLLAQHAQFHASPSDPLSDPAMGECGADMGLPGLGPAIDTLRRAFGAALHPHASAPLRGALLHGPSGTGKSALLSRLPNLVPPRAANILHIAATSIVSSRVGDAERGLAAVFAVARAIAPAVVVLDDVELLAPRRGAGDESDRDGASELFARVLSTLLVEIDGVKSDASTPNAYPPGAAVGKEGAATPNPPPVLVVAATRDPGLVDRALLRPGRLDLHVELPLPDVDARIRILRSFFEKRQSRITDFLADDEAMSATFAQMSEGWTAAEVIAYANDVVRDAALRRNAL